MQQQLQGGRNQDFWVFVLCIFLGVVVSHIVSANMGAVYQGYGTAGKGVQFNCRPVNPHPLNTFLLQCVKQNCSEKSHICLQQLEIKTPVFSSVRVNKRSNLLNGILANTTDNESYSIVKDF